MLQSCVELETFDGRFSFWLGGLLGLCFWSRLLGHDVGAVEVRSQSIRVRRYLGIPYGLNQALMRSALFGEMLDQLLLAVGLPGAVVIWIS